MQVLEGDTPEILAARVLDREHEFLVEVISDIVDGKILLGNKVWAGILLSVMYIVYAMCCLPAQGFNVVSSLGQMAEIITGSTLSSNSAFYYIMAIILVLSVQCPFSGSQRDGISETVAPSLFGVSALH